jgi:amino acid transporter
VRITLLTGVSIAIVAGIFRLDEIAELANAGTLIAFMAVGACLMVLRRRAPELPRLFRCPQPMLVGTLTILGCAYLLLSLPSATLVRFAAWNGWGWPSTCSTAAATATRDEPSARPDLKKPRCARLAQRGFSRRE